MRVASHCHRLLAFVRGAVAGVAGTAKQINLCPFLESARLLQMTASARSVNPLTIPVPAARLYQVMAALALKAMPEKGPDKTHPLRAKETTPLSTKEFQTREVT